MEEAGLVRREPNPKDKRQSLVYPTEKTLELLPLIKALSESWTSIIAEGVSKEEMAIFERVLGKLEKNATEAIGGDIK
jgi:DNA-binding MarR family transcriptional regulator